MVLSDLINICEGGDVLYTPLRTPLIEYLRTKQAGIGHNIEGTDHQTSYQQDAATGLFLISKS